MPFPASGCLSDTLPTSLLSFPVCALWNPTWPLITLHSVQQDAMGGVHNLQHPAGFGQGSNRLSSLEAQGCLGVAAEGRLGTKWRCFIYHPLPNWRSGITIPGFMGWGSWKNASGKSVFMNTSLQTIHWIIYIVPPSPDMLQLKMIDTKRGKRDMISRLSM